MDYSIYQEMRQSHYEHINDEYALWYDDINPQSTSQLTEQQRIEAVNFKKYYPKVCNQKTLDEIYVLYLGEF